MGNKNRRRRREVSIEEVKVEKSGERVSAQLRDEEDDEVLPKDLWIYSISANNAKLPAIQARTKQVANRSKSTALNGSKN